MFYLQEVQVKDGKMKVPCSKRTAGSRPETSVLFRAASRGHHECLATIIDAEGANVNATDSLNNSPLMYAAAGGHDRCVHLLIKEGANVNLIGARGEPALMKALIHSGSDVNVLEHFVQLDVTTKRHHDNCIKLLLEAGAHVNIVDDTGKSLLIHAVAKGNIEHVARLFQTDIDVNLTSESGETALTKAVSEDYPDLVDLLISSGADVNHAVNKRNTILQIASASVNTLLVAGADVNALNKINGSTALHYAAQTGQNTIMETLIQAGADVNITDANGNSPLHVLTSAKNIFTTELCMKLLLNAGAKINVKNKFGFNALKCYIGKLQLISNKVAMLLFVAGEAIEETNVKIESSYGSCSLEIPACLKQPKVKLDLKYICRGSIREHFMNIDPHLPLFKRVKELGLPPVLTSYLLYDMSLDRRY